MSTARVVLAALAGTASLGGVSLLALAARLRDPGRPRRR